MDEYMNTSKRLILSIAGLCLGCVPDLGVPSSLIQSPRVLAVRSEPAEATPGETVRLMLYAADPAGPVVAATVDWAWCSAPKPPVESNVISERCLSDLATPLPSHELSIITQVPSDACALFGPELPPQGPGEPALRPRDPDRTGGYYQPVRARLLGLTTIGGVRIRCGLVGAAPAIAARFRSEYVPNRNPEATVLGISVDNVVVTPGSIPARRELALHLHLLPQTVERFLLFDSVQQSLQSTPETLRVSWLSAQGQFRISTTTASDESQVQNHWIAPDNAGPVLLWTVLRDDRGGVSVLSHVLQVEDQ